MEDGLLMRCEYCCSERGAVLTADSNTPTFTVSKALDGAVLLGPGADLDAVRAFCAKIDPTITDDPVTHVSGA